MTVFRAHKNKFKVKSNGSSRGAGMAASGAQSIGLDIDPGQAVSNKIKSVLETDDLTDFLERAELADRDFASERERFVVVDEAAQEVPRAQWDDGGKSAAEKAIRWDDAVVGGGGEADGHHSAYYNAAKFSFKELSVPRRPKWDKKTTPQELDRNEKESFLNWRRNIAMKEEEIAAVQTSSNSRVTVTPFEKNIEVWRQLWRVLERSHCIVLVVDGRNPQFYLSTDLRTYVEDELGKTLMVVVNKCDYLTKTQREMWHEYFKSMDGLEHVFFSAVDEQQILDGMARDDGDVIHQEIDGTGIHDIDERGYSAGEDYPTLLNPEKIGIDKPLARKELLDILCAYAEMNGVDFDGNDGEDASTAARSRVEFGMVGFPNVGKSSVLNVLVAASKNNHKASRVGVACQPGKTKHFQTLNVPDYENITLVDCPGLVFPSFVSSSADLVLAGVYPLSQAKDFWPAVELICRRIPRDILEAHFGIELPRPSALDVAQQGGSMALKAPTAEELLGTYCIARSLLAPSSGVPDYYRASRVILRDYVTGNLLYCHCPSTLTSNQRQADNRKWEATFHHETLATTFRRQKKLRDRLGIVENAEGQFQSMNQTVKDGDEAEGTADLALENDFGILELVDMGDTPNGGKRGKKHKSMQKWGKKGRKQRNKDPYGCHSKPDEELLSTSGGAGLVVNAGKYGNKSYTRMNHRGARSAT